MVVGGALLAAAPSAHAQDGSPRPQEDSSQAALEFVGTPSVRYAKVSDGERRFYSLAAVVRLSVPIERAATGFPVAPELSTGDDIEGSAVGGNPASSIGEDSRHCYSMELQRPRPVGTPEEGARWRLGVTTSQTVRDTVEVTLKTVKDSDWERQAAERLGCMGASDSDDSDDLVGKRVPVEDGVEQVLVNTRPNEVVIGSLHERQTFKVRKLSASGKYAYGFAYGSANKVGWVLTSELDADG
jgi:hypothetical protein